jgi:hypothetical protein
MSLFVKVLYFSGFFRLSCSTLYLVRISLFQFSFFLGENDLLFFKQLVGPETSREGSLRLTRSAFTKKEASWMVVVKNKKEKKKGKVGV